MTLLQEQKIIVILSRRIDHGSFVDKLARVTGSFIGGSFTGLVGMSHWTGLDRRFYLEHSAPQQTAQFRDIFRSISTGYYYPLCCLRPTHDLT